MSSSREFRWVDGYDGTEIAIKNANTQEAHLSIDFNLSDNKAYWVVAWQQCSEYRVPAFEKVHIVTANKFNIRIFSEGSHIVFINDENVSTTQSGATSSHIVLDDCSALRIGNSAIDLCAKGSYGQAYLIIIDSQGNYLVAAE